MPRWLCTYTGIIDNGVEGTFAGKRLGSRFNRRVRRYIDFKKLKSICGAFGSLEDLLDCLLPSLRTAGTQNDVSVRPLSEEPLANGTSDTLVGAGDKNALRRGRIGHGRHSSEEQTNENEWKDCRYHRKVEALIRPIDSGEISLPWKIIMMDRHVAKGYDPGQCGPRATTASSRALVC